MQYFTLNLTDAEWRKIERETRRVWPEQLARNEVLRRSCLVGALALQTAPPEAAQTLADQFDSLSHEIKRGGG